MDMIKYIVKRLLLSVLILFGVSVIIYSLARMMPTDYVDNQYSSAVSQGTMRQEDVDRIKELYGLSMPDAYLRMKVGTGSSFAGDTFSKNTKQATYDEDVSLGLMTWEAWYEGAWSSMPTAPFPSARSSPAVCTWRRNPLPRRLPAGRRSPLLPVP